MELRGTPGAPRASTDHCRSFLLEGARQVVGWRKTMSGTHARTLSRRPGRRQHGNGRSYEVGRLLERAASGRFYLARAVKRSRSLPARVCLKVSASMDGWMRETYFAKLYGGDPRVLHIYDAFPAERSTSRFALVVPVCGMGPSRQLRQFAVSDQDRSDFVGGFPLACSPLPLGDLDEARAKKSETGLPLDVSGASSRG
jgi:hypothetical protein